MKQLKLLLLGAVSALLMLFVVFIPMRANAATIENGVPTALQREGKAFYKFTLEDDSLITLNWVKNNRDLACFQIYLDRNKTQSLTYGYYPFGEVSGKIIFPLKRGTYYVEMFDGDSKYAPTTKVKFSWTSAKNYSKDNYSLATAKTLKANTLEEVVQIRKYNYTRWYKISLKKAQRIIVESANDFSYLDLTILDSKLNSVYQNYSDYDFILTTKVPKGTYYIVIPEDSYLNTSPFGEYIAFRWR